MLKQGDLVAVSKKVLLHNGVLSPQGLFKIKSINGNEGTIISEDGKCEITGIFDWYRDFYLVKRETALTIN